MLDLIRKAIDAAPALRAATAAVRWMAGSVVARVPVWAGRSGPDRDRRLLARFRRCAARVGHRARRGTGAWRGGARSPGLAEPAQRRAPCASSWPSCEPPDDERRSRLPAPRTAVAAADAVAARRTARARRSSTRATATAPAAPRRLPAGGAAPPTDRGRRSSRSTAAAGSSGTRSEQGIPLLNHLARPRLGRLQHRLPAEPAGDLPRPRRRREAGDRLGARARRGVRRGPRLHLPHGRLGGRPPVRARRAHAPATPAFQPGFEDADTSVAAAVPVLRRLRPHRRRRASTTRSCSSGCSSSYVFKARLDDEPERFRAASPIHRVHADAPPFLVLHGERDTLVPVADARTVRGASCGRCRESPVLYAELAGAEHAFDILPVGAHGPRRGGDRALPRDRPRRAPSCRAGAGRSVRLRASKSARIREGDPWT